MIIYINGYWNRFTGLLGISPGMPEEAYWNYFSPLFIEASREFLTAATDEANYFIDGSSLFGIDQLAGERYQKGLRYGKEHFQTLQEGLKNNETFKIVSHSEGCAFAAGLADFLLTHHCIVSRILYLSPREGADFMTPPDSFAVQAHFINDPVCFPKRISGINVYITLLKLEEKKAPLRYAHGGTVQASTLRKMQKVLAMLPREPETKQPAGIWTITETMKGFDFKREADIKTI